MCDPIRSIDDVCEVEWVSADGKRPQDPPRVLFEVPHGATRTDEYEALRRRLTSPLPARLERFFYVNTDVGAPECARAAARVIVGPDSPGETQASALIVRCRIPRTFVDCNRRIEVEGGEYREQRLTPALPEYITSAEDRELLGALNARYQETTEQAYRLVCGNGGLAVTLHTYAPRSVDIHRVDDDIVQALEQAYRPESYEQWPERPAVDLICEDSDGARLAPESVVQEIRELYRQIGIEVSENATYRLHPSTTGYHHSCRHPRQVICVEINRSLLARPFSPFTEMHVPVEQAERLAAPLAVACRRYLAPNA